MLLRAFTFLAVLFSVSCVYPIRWSPRLSKSVFYDYETRYFDTLIDHFTFVGNATFRLKYLISTKFHKENGPILFYTGNEGSIEVFAENTGFMWDHAEELHAALVFAEHRYYGSSLPFGNITFQDPQHFGYLTVEQAMADYALLIANLTSCYPAFKSSPVIAVGGSYGGMLAAWMRIKYPNLVLGSIAASAPVWMFPNMSDCGGFNRVATEAFVKNGSKQCKDNIAAAWDRIVDLSKAPAGMTLLTKMFLLCEPLTDVQSLIDYLADFFGTIAMVNYPYNASFLLPLPSWPVSYLCQELSEFIPDEQPALAISRLATAVRRLTNYTKTQKCINLNDDSPNLDGQTWERQTCMEMIEPMCSDPTQSMFPAAEWNPDVYTLNCLKKFKVKPRFEWTNIAFLGKKLQTASNIIFSNGDLDPWSALGVLDNADVPHCNVVRIPSGAHHIDLRASNPMDPTDVRAARKTEIDIIQKWISEWRLVDPVHRKPTERSAMRDLLVYLISVIRPT